MGKKVENLIYWHDAKKELPKTDDIYSELVITLSGINNIQFCLFDTHCNFIEIERPSQIVNPDYWILASELLNIKRG